MVSLFLVTFLSCIYLSDIYSSSFVRSFVRLFVCLFVRSFVRSFVRWGYMSDVFPPTVGFTCCEIIWNPWTGIRGTATTAALKIASRTQKNTLLVHLWKRATTTVWRNGDRKPVLKVLKEQHHTCRPGSPDMENPQRQKVQRKAWRVSRSSRRWKHTKGC